MAEHASLPLTEQMGLSGQQLVPGPVFDVAPFGQIVAALKVAAIAGTTPQVDAYLEHSMDMDKWATLESFPSRTTTGLEIVCAVQFARYVRAVIDTESGSADMTATVSVLGIAREIGG